MNTTAYPGNGRPLYQATYSGSAPALLTYPTTPILTAGQYSDCEPISDAWKSTIQVVFNVAPTATTDIEFDVDPKFANPIVLGTLPIAAVKIATFQTAEALTGFVRIKNTSTQTINSVTIQKFLW